MSVESLLCPNCGAPISLEENKCKYCGTNYIVQSGKARIIQIDMKKIEHKEELMRNNLPNVVRQTLASYPKEWIVFTYEWTGLGGGQHFLVTNEKLVLFQGNMIHWIMPFEVFGGTSLGLEHSVLAAFFGVPKISMKIMDLKNNVWRKLPSVSTSGINSFKLLELKINNAYNLWLTKK